MSTIALEKFDFKSTFQELNRDILKLTGQKFDLGNFLQIRQFRGNEDVNFRKNISPEAQFAIDDNTRKRLKEILEKLAGNSDPSIGEELREILVRQILYIGSECERLGEINIEEEYRELALVLESEFMVLNRVKKPTYGDLLDDWERIGPSILFFSCHGDKLGFYLQGEDGKCKHYNTTTFVDFFLTRVKKTECVVLSACESIDPGKKILSFVPNVVCINKKVNIQTTRAFNRRFMKYLNDYSNEPSSVYENAFNHANEYIKGETLPDSFSFEFLKGKIKN